MHEPQRHRSPRAASAAIAVMLPLSSLHAGEYCIVCAAPAAQYRCLFDGDHADARVQLYCISELAKSGGHGTCSVERQQASPCPGASTFEVPADLFAQDDPRASPGAEPRPDPRLHGAAEPQHQTVIEKRTTDAPQKNDTAGSEPDDSTLSQAGRAVSDAAKKSWRCVTSLFGDC